MIREIDYYTNMALGVYRLRRHPPLRDAAAVLREQMSQRELRFLDIARRVVFSNPQNPYLEMFRSAGCTWEDLAAAVGRSGLETTLSSLASEGVHLTHDEFKGKTPIIRAGREIRYDPGALLNPLTRGYMESLSGGSRSLGTPTRRSTEFQVYKEVYERLQTREFELDRRVRAQVRPILPSSLGITNALRLSRTGRGRVEKWFSESGNLRDSAHYRAVTWCLVGLGRFLGAHVPFPTFLPWNDFSPVAVWIAGLKKEGRQCVIRSLVSPALRVALAAREAGLDISGTLFLVGGEALTEAKRAGIEAAGCEVYPGYGISEVGPIGFACRQMRTGNCVHVFRDGVAVISRRRRAPLSDLEVNSLLFTNLLPFAPRFLINAEMDDSGILEPATCQCEYSAAGMNVQVRGIFSYGKLSGQGITLFGTDVVQILETTLPRRFGGAPGDYQLVEYEGASQTQLALRVSPRVGARATEDIRGFFLSEIRRCYGGTLAARLWKHSDGLEVVIAEPYATPSGKVLSLHLLGAKADYNHAS